MKTKKLEKTDIDLMTDIRMQYQDNNLKLGMITSDEYIINKQLEQIENAKSECFEKLNILREDEQKIIKDLEDKYGEGQINLEEGIFIPNS
jgi:phosphopantetheine adenylyltransferase